MSNDSGFVSNHRALLIREATNLATTRAAPAENGIHRLTEEEMPGL